MSTPRQATSIAEPLSPPAPHPPRAAPEPLPPEPPHRLGLHAPCSRSALRLEG